MDKTNLIDNMISKKHLLVRLFISLKYFSPNSDFFYLIVILIKLLGLLIISTSFVIQSNNYSYIISEVLRSATCFGIFINVISPTVYTGISFFLFILIATISYLFRHIYLKTKNDENYLATPMGKTINTIVSGMFVVLLVLSNHIAEFCSVTYLIQFNSNTSVLIPKYQNMPILVSPDKTLNLIVMFVNTLTIVFINLFFYFSFKILNEPFFNSTFPIKFRFNNFSIFLTIFISNLQMIHYIEIFINTQTGLLYYKSGLLAVVYILIIISFLRSLSKFNFESLLSKLIKFFLTFSIFSTTLEIILYSTQNEVASFANLFVILACKIILTISFLIMYDALTKKILLSKIDFTLFKSFDGKVSENEIESIYGLIQLIIKIQDADFISLKDIIDLILNHRLICVYDSCKCNLITSFRKETLSEDLFFILEMIFTKLNLGQDLVSIFLFAEYLSVLKNMNLFSYSLINTFINKNMKKLRSLQLVQIYSLCINYTDTYYQKFSQIKDYQKFIKIYNIIKLIKSYDKMLIKFSDNFENILNFKEKLDNTLKYTNDHAKIDSYAFENLDELVVNCKNFREEYKQIKQKVKKDFSLGKCKHVELSYKLNNFFMIFNKKVPENLKYIITPDLSYSVMYKKNIHKYLDKELNKFMQKNVNNEHNIIIEINNIFKIKYISSKLCEILGYEQSKLLGDDLHSIFPKQLKELHKKVLLHYFLIKKQMYFQKTTFAFTSTNETIPIDFKVATFPNLEKNLQAIVSIKLLDISDKRIYQFVMSSEYEVFAVSKNFEKDYCLNNESIEKSKINILKLFEINELIQTKFLLTMNRLAELKYEKQQESLYCMSNFLFNMRSTEDNNFGIIGMTNSNKNDEDNKIEKKLMKKNFNNSHYVVEPMNQQDYSMNKITDRPTKIQFQTNDNTTNLEFNNTNTNLLDNGENRVLTTNINVNVSNVDSREGILKPNSLSRIEGAFGNLRRTTLHFINSDVEDSSMLQQIKKPKRKPQNQSESIKNIDPEFTVLPNNQNLTLKREKSLSNVNSAKLNSNLNINLNNQSENCTQFYMTTGKPKVINNFETLKNRCYDMHLDDVYYNKIADCIKRLKSNIGTVNIPGSNRLGVFSESFDIKVELRLMNDHPFFVIKIRDNFQIIPNETINKPDLNLSPILDSTKRSQKGARKTNLQVGKKNDHKDHNPPAIANRQLNLLNISLRNSPEKLPMTNSEPGSLALNKQPTSNLPNTKSRHKTSLKDSSSNISESKFYYTKLVRLIIILLLSSLILSGLGYYFKDYSLNNSFILYTVSYYNLLQQASLFFLQSSLVTLRMQLGNLINLEYGDTIMNTQDILNLIAIRSNDHRENYKIFYGISMFSPFNSVSIMSIVDSQVTFNKTLLNWENINSLSTFSDESDRFAANTKLLSLETDLSKLTLDIDNFFMFDNYVNERSMLQNSKFSQLIYFANENIPYAIATILDQINSTSSQNQQDYYDSRVTVVFLMESSEIVLSILLIITIYYVLNQYDKKLFEILLKMFVNLGLDKKLPFKSPNEILILKNRIKNFKVLLKVFNRNHIKKYQDSIKNPLNISKKIKSQNENFVKGIEEGSMHENYLFNTEKKQMEINLMKDNLNNSINSRSIFNSTNLNISNNLTSKMLLAQTPTSVLNNLNSNTNSVSISRNHLKNAKDDQAMHIKNLYGGSIILDDNLAKSEMNKQTTNIKKKNKYNSVINNVIAIKIITNNKVLNKTKHHQLFILKLAKNLILSIFLTYIILMLVYLVINNIFYNKINIACSFSDLVMTRVSILTEMLNALRINIMSNNTARLQYKFNGYVDEYMECTNTIITNINEHYAILPNTYNFTQILNTPMNSSGIDIASLLCTTNTLDETCASFVNLPNGINSQGFDLGIKTMLQTMSNIFKDYTTSDLSNFNTNSMVNLFNNTDFFNVIMQMEYVLENVNDLFSVYVMEDVLITHNFTDLLSRTFGSIKIVVCFFILVYLVFAFSRQLKEYQNFILYTSEKFNRALFRSSMENENNH